MFYIEKDNKIVLFGENYSKIADTVKLMPLYQNLEIKETNRPIIDFEFADTPEWEEKQKQKESNKKTEEIKSKLNELDLKRIRAVCENEIKNPETGETWLEFYNTQIKELREFLSA